jgi:hypothetical protein
VLISSSSSFLLSLVEFVLFLFVWYGSFCKNRKRVYFFSNTSCWCFQFVIDVHTCIFLNSS